MEIDLRSETMSIRQENFSLKEKINELKQELDKTKQQVSSLLQTYQELQLEYESEVSRNEETIKGLKLIIQKLDSEKQELERRVKFSYSEQDLRNKLVELKQEIADIEEEHKLEKEAIREQMEELLEELHESNHQREEALSHNQLLREELEKLKKLESGALLPWVLSRKNRRNNQMFSARRKYKQYLF